MRVEQVRRFYLSVVEFSYMNTLMIVVNSSKKTNSDLFIQFNCNPIYIREISNVIQYIKLIQFSNSNSNFPIFQNKIQLMFGYTNT